MSNIHGFTITVNRKSLLNKLVENLGKHKENYTIAINNYKSECIKLLQDRLGNLEGMEKLKDPKRWLAFDLPHPTYFADDYEQVIGMLKFSEDDEIRITAEQYQNWVEDKWNWAEHFFASTMSYVPKK